MGSYALFLVMDLFADVLFSHHKRTTFFLQCVHDVG